MSVCVHVKTELHWYQSKEVSGKWSAPCELQILHKLTQSSVPTWTTTLIKINPENTTFKVADVTCYRSKQCLEGSLTWRDEDAVGEFLVWRLKMRVSQACISTWKLICVWAHCLIWDFPLFVRRTPPQTHSYKNDKMLISLYFSIEILSDFLQVKQNLKLSSGSWYWPFSANNK